MKKEGLEVGQRSSPRQRASAASSASGTDEVTPGPCAWIADSDCPSRSNGWEWRSPRMHRSPRTMQLTLATRQRSWRSRPQPRVPAGVPGARDEVAMVAGRQGFHHQCSDGWGVAPETTAAEQEQGSHNIGQGELGVLRVLSVQYILLLGSHTVHRVEQM